MIGCASPIGSDPILAEPLVPPPVSPNTPHTWRPLTNSATFSAAVPQLMTDGTVLVQEADAEDWWKLTPDNTGGYASGTWSQVASMAPGYSPLYYGSAVLPDGRLIIVGGEYIAGAMAFSTQGAIYDPIADQWTTVQPPVDGTSNWDRIGDASGVVLPDGHFMLSACCTKALAILDPVTLTWTATGDGKADINDEESWAVLPDDTILTVDANNATDLMYSEIYTPATGDWTPGGDTPVEIADTNADLTGSHEVGPEVSRPDGTVVAIGGNGHNALYDTTTQTWNSFPDSPMGLQSADGPGAIMPNGDVLLAQSAGVFQTPTHFFELHDTTFTEVAAPPHAINDSSYNNFFLVLPTGEILMTDFSNDVEIYTPAPGVSQNAVPVILEAPQLDASTEVPTLDDPVTSLYLNRTYTVSVRRMNGISQGAYYGDDVQSYSNIPIVRVTNNETHHAMYCRTYNHSNRSLAPDSFGTTKFDVPLTAERGLSTLVVIANGIASPPIAVSVK